MSQQDLTTLEEQILNQKTGINLSKIVFYYKYNVTKQKKELSPTSSSPFSAAS